MNYVDYVWLKVLLLLCCLPQALSYNTDYTNTRLCCAHVYSANVTVEATRVHGQRARLRAHGRSVSDSNLGDSRTSWGLDGVARQVTFMLGLSEFWSVPAHAGRNACAQSGLFRSRDMTVLFCFRLASWLVVWDVVVVVVVVVQQLAKPTVLLWLVLGYKSNSLPKPRTEKQHMEVTIQHQQSCRTTTCIHTHIYIYIYTYIYIYI